MGPRLSIALNMGLWCGSVTAKEHGQCNKSGISDTVGLKQVTSTQMGILMLFGASIITMQPQVLVLVIR